MINTQSASGSDEGAALSEAPEYAAWMDTIRSVEVVRQYKQHSFELLNLTEGSRVLDVGCGTGDDARALAELVGSTGRIVGIDSSERLISEARERSAGVGLPVEFRLLDAHSLDFPDGAFDASRSDRTFQHLEQPQRALTQMVRVTRSGGVVCLCEPDWDTMVVDSPDRALSRTILRFAADHVRNGWMGRQLRRLMTEAGLTEVTVTPFTLTAVDYPLAARVFGLEYAVTQCQLGGVISPEAGTEWLRSLAQGSSDGTFFAASTVFVAAGRKPTHGTSRVESV